MVGVQNRGSHQGIGMCNPYQSGNGIAHKWFSQPRLCQHHECSWFQDSWLSLGLGFYDFCTKNSRTSRKRYSLCSLHLPCNLWTQDLTLAAGTSPSMIPLWCFPKVADWWELATSAYLPLVLLLAHYLALFQTFSCFSSFAFWSKDWVRHRCAHAQGKCKAFSMLLQVPGSGIAKRELEAIDIMPWRMSRFPQAFLLSTCDLGVIGGDIIMSTQLLLGKVGEVVDVECPSTGCRLPVQEVWTALLIALSTKQKQERRFFSR